MTERQFQIAFERQLSTIIPQYNTAIKLNSDTIFHYLNRAKDTYINTLYRSFQLNQELSDRLRTLVVTKELTPIAIDSTRNIFTYDYPTDYLYVLGEEVDINVEQTRCPNLKSKSRDVIEATIETIDRILENSLSEYHLHHGQARPVRLFTDNQIKLHTDGQYTIKSYYFTYLRTSYDLGNKLNDEYTELPEITHQDIVDAAVALFIQEASTNNNEDN